jgi:2-methylisocitrate lyase-like PEP mutase family enzyme
MCAGVQAHWRRRSFRRGAARPRSDKRCVKEAGIPTFANIIEGGKTENLSAKGLAELGFCAVAYPWTLVAANL